MHHVERLASIEDLGSMLGLGSLPSAPFASSPEDWSIEPELLKVILALVSDLRPHTVVEIGTYKGKTAAAIGRQLGANGFGTIYTIDNGSRLHALSARMNFTMSGANRRIVQLRRSSVVAFEEWGRAKIDLLIVDGGHDYVSAVTDLALWPRLLSDRAWMIIHDTRTRLLRKFPEDYLFPMSIYDIIEVPSVRAMKSGHEWEGVAFVRFTDSYRQTVQ